MFFGGLVRLAGRRRFDDAMKVSSVFLSTRAIYEYGMTCMMNIHPSVPRQPFVLVICFNLFLSPVHRTYDLAKVHR